MSATSKPSAPRWKVRVLARYKMRRGWAGLFAGTRAGVLQTGGEDATRWRVLLDDGGWREATLIQARRGVFWVWLSLHLEDAVVFVSGRRQNVLEATVWRTAVKSDAWRRLNILAGAADGKPREVNPPPEPQAAPVLAPQPMAAALPAAMLGDSPLLARPRRARRARPAASPLSASPGEERHDV
jgi:hypothetical protein